jgi:hypothetical protein
VSPASGGTTPVSRHRSFRDVALLPPPGAAQPESRREPPRPVFKLVARPASSSKAPRPSPDAEGWVEVRSRRRPRGPPPPRRSIPQDLRGRCFNCMAPSHKAFECRRPVRCFTCRSLGHRAAWCPARPQVPLRKSVSVCPARPQVPLRKSVSVWDRLGPLPDVAKPRSVLGAGAAAQVHVGAKGRRHRTRGRRSNPPLVLELSAPHAPLPAVEGTSPQSLVADNASAPRGCVLERSDAISRVEFRLQRCALFVVITGSRPRVAKEVFAAEVAAGFGLPEDSFSVHRSSPEDFVLILNSEQAAIEVYNNGSVFNSPSGSFKFIRWSGLAHAEVVSFPSLVMVEFGGILVHAWELATAQNLLRDICSDVELHPDTVNRFDFSSFKVFGWCYRPHLIPDSFELLIPVRVFGSGGPPAVRRLLSYSVTASVSRVPLAEAAVPPSFPPAPTSDGGDRETGSRRPRLGRGAPVRLDGSSSAVSSAASQSGRRHVHERLDLAPMHGRHVASGRWPLHGGVQGGDGSFPVTARAGPEERGRDPIDGGALFGGVILAPEVDAVAGRAEGPGSNGGSSQGPSVGFPSSSGGPDRSLESVGPVRPLEIVGPEIELHLGGSGVDSGGLRSTFVGGGVAPSPAAGATPVAAKARMVPAADAGMPTAGAPPVAQDAGMAPAADAGLVPPLPTADAPLVTGNADMAPAAVGPPSSFPAAASGGLPVAGSGEPSSSSAAPPVLSGGMKSLRMMLGPGTRIWPRSPITYSRKGRRVVASPVLSPAPAQPGFVERMSKAVDSILDDPPM